MTAALSLPVTVLSRRRARGARDPRRDGLVVLIAVGMVHAVVGYGVLHSGGEARMPRPLPVVQVSLITRPAPQVTPLRRPAHPVHSAPRTAQADTPSLAPPATAAAPPAAKETSPPSAADPSAPPSSETPSDFREPVYSAAYLDNPPPVYPLAARRRGQEGTAIVRAQVLHSGDCAQAALLHSSGYALLDHAALAAVKQWRFVPARRGNSAVDAWVEVPITFHLPATPSRPDF
jgi:protein TonB